MKPSDDKSEAARYAKEFPLFVKWAMGVIKTTDSTFKLRGIAAAGRALHELAMKRYEELSNERFHDGL